MGTTNTTQRTGILSPGVTDGERGPPPDTLKIVSIDIPDADNFLMVLQILTDFTGHIAVVLSPRPVSFDVPRYGPSEWFEFRKDCGGKRLVTAQENYKEVKNESTTKALAEANLTATSRTINAVRRTQTWNQPDWVSDLPARVQPWFTYPDEDARLGGYATSAVKLKIKDDTELYMQVSAWRLVHFLDSHHIPAERYQLYWDPESMDKVAVGMRHAHHYHDYTYDFEGAEMDKYQEATAKYDEEHRWATEEDDIQNTKRPKFKGDRSQNLRAGMRSVCKDYVARMVRKFGHTGGGSPLNKFQTLIDENAAYADTHGTQTDIFVGGPFTETLKYIKKGPSVHKIIGMGGFIHGGTNIFDNQFNFHVDLASAAELLDLVSKPETDVKLVLLPTECAKNDDTTLSKEEVMSIKKISPAAGRLLEQYHLSKFPCAVFDWITAIVASRPELLDKRPVRHVVKYGTPQKSDNEQKQNTRVPLKITFVEEKGARIQMYWNDEDKLKKAKPDFWQHMKSTLTTQGRGTENAAVVK